MDAEPENGNGGLHSEFMNEILGLPPEFVEVGPPPSSASALRRRVAPLDPEEDVEALEASRADIYEQDAVSWLCREWPRLRA
jgi:hypothetical protein